MKDPQQEADELIEKYKEMKVICAITERTKLPISLRIEQAIQCALIDNQNTIDVLASLLEDEDVSYFDVIEHYTRPLLDHHTQVRTILKSRLK